MLCFISVGCQLGAPSLGIARRAAEAAAERGDDGAVGAGVRSHGDKKHPENPGGKLERSEWGCRGGGGGGGEGWERGGRRGLGAMLLRGGEVAVVRWSGWVRSAGNGRRVLQHLLCKIARIPH